MRTLLLVAALAGAAPCLPGAVPTGGWGVRIRDVVDDGVTVEGTLSVRAGGRFLLECRVSGAAWGPDSKTAVWGIVTIAGDVATGRVEGGEARIQLPNRKFVLRLGDRPAVLTSNIPGCPREGQVQR